MIKFLDLQAINAAYEEQIEEAVIRATRSGWYLRGEETRRFEAAYAKYIGSRHAICCGNGLDALRLIFRAYIEMGLLHEGDEVIVPANTYIASILAVTDNRLKPIFVEPDIDTLQIIALRTKNCNALAATLSELLRNLYRATMCQIISSIALRT